jgi:hypothetical protein
MNTYNGWSNYATWRINLEMLDGFEADSNMPVEDLADYLQEYCISLIEESTPDGLAKDYAFAFLGDVNWYEIAEHIKSNQDEEEETNVGGGFI